MITQNETLILGIGNSLLSDEGAGIHALNLIRSEYTDIPNLTFLDGGTLSFTLASWIEDCDNLVVFDAAELNMPPGSVRTFAGAEMDNFLGASKRSAHEVGLIDLMDIARITDHLPVNRAIIGIQPEYMDWGMQPTRAVHRALPIAVNEAVKLIQTWNNEQLRNGKTDSKQNRNKTSAELPDTRA
ncbi:MAG: HyaD/HybD family hydrogenase maturation endopeptidase [Thiotrichales bacterium]|nr:MAG: HyaD/HybD family hydrogenase maturation endopeptidase [Thiotrichales bacterium]